MSPQSRLLLTMSSMALWALHPETQKRFTVYISRLTWCTLVVMIIRRHIYVPFSIHTLSSRGPWSHAGYSESSCWWMSATWFTMERHFARAISASPSLVEAAQYRWLTMDGIHFLILSLSFRPAQATSFFLIPAIFRALYHSTEKTAAPYIHLSQYLNCCREKVSVPLATCQQSK